MFSQVLIAYFLITAGPSPEKPPSSRGGSARITRGIPVQNDNLSLRKGSREMIKSVLAATCWVKTVCTVRNLSALDVLEDTHVGDSTRCKMHQSGVKIRRCCQGALQTCRGRLGKRTNDDLVPSPCQERRLQLRSIFEDPWQVGDCRVLREEHGTADRAAQEAPRTARIDNFGRKESSMGTLAIGSKNETYCTAMMLSAE